MMNESPRNTTDSLPSVPSPYHGIGGSSNKINLSPVKQQLSPTKQKGQRKRWAGYGRIKSSLSSIFGGAKIGSPSSKKKPSVDQFFGSPSSKKKPSVDDFFGRPSSPKHKKKPNADDFFGSCSSSPTTNSPSSKRKGRIDPETVCAEFFGTATRSSPTSRPTTRSSPRRTLLANHNSNYAVSQSTSCLQTGSISRNRRKMLLNIKEDDDGHSQNSSVSVKSVSFRHNIQDVRTVVGAQELSPRETLYYSPSEIANMHQEQIEDKQEELQQEKQRIIQQRQAEKVGRKKDRQRRLQARRAARQKSTTLEQAMDQMSKVDNIKGESHTSIMTTTSSLLSASDNNRPAARIVSPDRELRGSQSGIISSSAGDNITANNKSEALICLEALHGITTKASSSAGGDLIAGHASLNALQLDELEDDDFDDSVYTVHDTSKIGGSQKSESWHASMSVLEDTANNNSAGPSSPEKSGRKRLSTVAAQTSLPSLTTMATRDVVLEAAAAAADLGMGLGSKNESSSSPLLTHQPNAIMEIEYSPSGGETGSNNVVSPSPEAPKLETAEADERSWSPPIPLFTHTSNNSNKDIEYIQSRPETGSTHEGLLPLLTHQPKAMLEIEYSPSEGEGSSKDVVSPSPEAPKPKTAVATERSWSPPIPVFTHTNNNNNSTSINHNKDIITKDPRRKHLKKALSLQAVTLQPPATTRKKDRSSSFLPVAENDIQGTSSCRSLLDGVRNNGEIDPNDFWSHVNAFGCSNAKFI